nr:amino acid adenylation domain-containing protein [Clostridia bacterium]
MKNTYLQPLMESFKTNSKYVAIVDEGGKRQTTYKELYDLTCKVVGYLKEKKIKPQSFIPIMLPSCFEYLAIEIGLWLSDCVAVPMGPSFPPDRVEYICNHCEAPFIIDEHELEIIKKSKASTDFKDPDMNDYCILIYTSGSTGTPKGIIHTFASADAKHSKKVAIKYTHEDHWGATSPLYFIAAMANYKVLKDGGQVHFLDDETRKDVKKIADYVEKYKLTFIFLSPSVLANFTNKSKSLKVVFTGSEKVSGLSSKDGYKLFNCYGMTETFGTALTFVVKHPYETTPVGIPECEWKLFDDNGKEVKVGEVGELCLKDVFTPGYFKDEEKTKQLYRGGYLHTNDLMRQLPDGNLVYVNRKDWMIKINGQRVEPGEVENVIKKLDGVQNAIVKGFDGDNGNQYIVAFYKGDVDGDSLREIVAKKLPPYMVPLHFVKVKEFSLLPNGKVNRKILAAPTSSNLVTTYVAPTNKIEEQLCNAFAAIFGLEKAGITDDFFLLGGDSIKVMALQQKCADLDLSSKIIYKERTPQNIAKVLKVEEKIDTKSLEKAPLSQTQLGIYTECMLKGIEAKYNNPVLFKLNSKLDEKKLAKAVEKVIEAHPLVKCIIKEDENQTPCMIRNHDPYVQEIINLTEAEFETVKKTLIKPFDLHNGPLFRIGIYRTEKNLYFFFDFHHIIYDGTSMRIFMADLDNAYLGNPIEEETYDAFAVSLDEEKNRNGDLYKEAKQFYESTFGSLDIESKPTISNYETNVTFGSKDLDIDLPYEYVDNYCKRIGITANVFAIAAFGKLLGTYKNSREALFATIYNGRQNVKTARTIDMMVKTLPVYCHWDKDTKLVDYLQELKDQVLNCMNNDIYSFAEVSKLTGLTSDVLFAYQGNYLTLGKICGEEYIRVPLEDNATGSAINFQLFANQDKHVLHVEYMSNQYSDFYISEMMETYANILKGFLNEEYVKDVELLNEKQITFINSINAPATAYDDTQTIVSLFKTAASKYPDNKCIIFKDKAYTYKEVDNYTDRLATIIKNKGLGVGDVVSILIPRGEWMIIASLAVQKTGCTYQPLDSTYPQERLEFMVQDADSKLLITTEELKDIVNKEGLDKYIISEPNNLPKEKDKFPLPSIENIMVLLYTSGSTGVPKGVRLANKNLVCFINWYHKFYNLDSTDSVGAYASYGFDANMMDMYTPITIGAACVIIPEEIRLDFLALNEYLEKNNVTNIFMTTQVGRQFALDVDNKTLKQLSLGGEKLISTEFNKPYKVFNAYGPTECTIYSTIYEVTKKENNIPLGKMLDNLHGYIVSLDNKRVPIYAEGELWIAGRQVSCGYLNRPEKTAEVFIENPFEKDEYAKLYKSGDVVRYKEDKNIEFIGRRDGQVKIRGFRIELSEVEEVIRQFADIKDATVAAFDHPSGGKFIAAYVVSDKQIDTNALSAFIKQQKPPYMAPAVIMQIDKIPLNQNQKVNKRALPVPEYKPATTADDANRSLNLIEQKLHDIVEKVLGVKEFSVSAPLIELGLTSILSIKLSMEIYKVFNITIESKNLLDGSSIIGIENIILEYLLNPKNREQATEQVAKFEKLNEAVLTYAQTGVYFESLKNPENLSYHIPAMFKFDKALDVSLLEQSLYKIIETHPELNVHFEQKGEKIVQLTNAEPIKIEKTTVKDKDIDKFTNEFVLPFNIGTGPLCKISIVETESSYYLYTDFHHLVFDGTSTSIFFKDLENLLSNNEIEKEVLPYFNYAKNQADKEATQSYIGNQEYFKKMFADFEHASSIPEDLKGKEYEGKQATVAIPINFEKISNFCKDTKVTPAALMLASTFYTICRYINDKHVYISTISSGRSNVQLSNTVGMFVNTLPLGIEIKDKTTLDFIKECSALLNDTINHEEYPFAKIASDFGFAPEIVYEYQIGVLDKLNIPHCNSITSLERNDIKFKLSIHIEYKDNKECIVVYYNDSLYSKEYITEFAKSLEIVADKLSTSADKSILKIDLLNDEREAVLAKIRNVGKGETTTKLYHEGLEEQAKLVPDKIALIATNETLTYKEFNAKANRIAHVLLALGVKKQSKIVLLLPRTSHVILSMFGIMKAGCAYIPCDPVYPKERIDLIIDDSAAPYIITTKDKLSLYPNALDVEMLLTNTNEENPNLDISPDDLCYLIYTSGSTGRPKGVMLRHEGAANFNSDAPANILIRAYKEYAHTLLSVTTISFDMSVKEIGSTLAVGNTLVFANEAETNEPSKLAELFKKTNADAFNATPSRLKQYLELPSFAEAISKCKLVISGGEKYPIELLRQLQTLTKARIFNTYGPTEITVSSNMKELTNSDIITVGKPIYNVTEFVVDSDGNELPVGIVGELYIGGRGVARGYNNLEKQNKERFIEYKGIRVYKSGDYAKWTNDGDVIILGRLDHQIKLRGLRIELGEIESVLSKVPGIKSSLIKINVIRGMEHLTAYYTADRKISMEELRGELSKTLTKYMVPTAYLQLDKMPLTPNGKIDIKNLPEPELFQVGGKEEAKNELEKMFCEIFQSILGLDKVGATDSFFDIGGTSLSAIRVTVEGGKKGYTLTYSDVFSNPTPRALAKFCGADDTANTFVDKEVSDYDYSKIDEVLKKNTLESFLKGKSSEVNNILLTGPVGYLGIHI